MPRVRPTRELAREWASIKRRSEGRLGGRETVDGHDYHLRGQIHLHDPDWCRACLLRDLNNSEEVTHANDSAEPQDPAHPGG